MAKKNKENWMFSFSLFNCSILCFKTQQFKFNFLCVILLAMLCFKTQWPKFHISWDIFFFLRSAFYSAADIQNTRLDIRESGCWHLSFLHSPSFHLLMLMLLTKLFCFVFALFAINYGFLNFPKSCFLIPSSKKIVELLKKHVSSMLNSSFEPCMWW